MSISRRTHRLLTLTASATLVAGLAGCGADDGPDPTGGTAFVVGARSNMPAPRLDGRALEALDTALGDQSLAAIVIADGEPHLVGPHELVIEGATGPAREASREDNRKAVGEAFASAESDDEESDLLGAIDLGVRSIESTNGAHTLVVVDSGLSTTGALDFTQPGVLDADPDALAADLAQAGELPDLEGVTVVLHGIGDTFAPQAPLTRPQRTNLVAIWEAIIRAAGGAVVVEQTPLTAPPADGLPRVTPVPGESAQCTVTLSEESVRFEANSAEFRDSTAAGTVLAPLAQQLARPGSSATVTGTTADVGDLAGQIELSLKRAQAVKSLLVELGARPDSMTASGLGSSFPEHVEDHDVNGTLLEEPAAQNRRVVVQIVGDDGLTCG